MNQKSFTEIKELMNEWIRLDYILPEDIPSIELYMDQITTFMESKLHGNKRNPEDKILTKTMINNYSKNDLLPPSNKKKYSKDHIILLIYIYYLKNFLSINDIQNLLKPVSDNYFQKQEGITMSTIYEDLFQLEKEYGIKIRESVAEVYEIADNAYSDKDDYLKTLTMITLLSYDIYAKKQLVEHLIDTIAVKPTSKEELKEVKDSIKQKERQKKEAAKQRNRQAKEVTKLKQRQEKNSANSK
ncbi:MAG: DUF1836 domain-containing protein [Lachnospiraceae bacterium]|nr:DUF1836 domain-containing protein [Lachnospiraceae bacterium]